MKIKSIKRIKTDAPTQLYDIAVPDYNNLCIKANNNNGIFEMIFVFEIDYYITWVVVSVVNSVDANSEFTIFYVYIVYLPLIE